jgi:hypothetical protein
MEYQDLFRSLEQAPVLQVHSTGRVTHQRITNRKLRNLLDCQCYTLAAVALLDH